jgi:hypothetical protein
VPIHTGPSAFVSMAAEDQDFASFCLDCVRGPWKQRAEDAYERFRAAMPMKTIMERLLAETVSMASRSMNTLATRDNGRRLLLKFGAATKRGSDPADAHLASVPLDRIRRMTAELQQDSGNDNNATTVSPLLNDYTTAVTHLRAVARLAEERIAAAAGPIRDASKVVRRALKSAGNA